MRILSIISLILACYTTTISQNDIQGPIAVCESECISYSYTSTEELYWTIIGGVVETNTGASVEICWQEATTGEINVSSLDNSVSASLTVIVNELPAPSILFPAFPYCSSQDSLDFQNEIQVIDFCQTVCGGETSILEISNPNATSNYTWVVEGENNNATTSTGIEIEWPDEGYGSVLLIEENSVGCVDSSFVCIEILEKPSLDINVINSQVNLSNLCQNQNIYLEALSDQTLSYSWASSDGQSTTGSAANFSFSSSGTYNITLTGVTECICSVEKTITVTVIDFVSPVIDCTGTTCTNEEMTYYAADICGSYNWSVGPNGTVIEGGTNSDNFITIEWTSGPYGVLSLATSSCDDAAICTEPAVVLIPVMGSSVTIEGPDEVCNDGTSTYYTQQYEGASYNWNLNGNGYITQGQGSNEVTIRWLPYYSSTNLATLTVDIENCFLACASRGEKEIKIEEPFFLYALSTYCEGNQANMSAYVGYDQASCNWSMVSPDNQIINIATNQSDVQVDFNNGPGIYEVIAEAVSSDYCNEVERVYVEVLEGPEAITEIEGPTLVCVGESAGYTIMNPDSRLEYKWIIEDGYDPLLGNNDARFTFFGEEVFHLWQSQGPYAISVSATDPETNCSSETYTLELFPAQTAVLQGNQIACVNDIATYTLEGVEGLNIEWTITPDNLGIIVPQEDNTVLVQWYEAGNATLVGDYCGESYNLTVDVVTDITGYNHDQGVCPGETTGINFDAGTNVISIINENGSILGTNNPQQVGSGFYEIVTSGINGCEDRSSTYIEEYLDPAVNLSSSNLNELCDDGIGEAILEALSTNESLTYTWYKEGVNLNLNTPTITVTEDGLYTVEVVNGNNCVATDVLEVECRTGRCDCRPDGGVAFTYQQGEFCNEFEFTNASFDFIPGTLSYEFGDPDSPNNFTTDENPSHVFTQAGHFIVIIRGVVPHATNPGETCAASFYDFITVEAAADFTSTPSCEGEAMEFFEAANFLPGFSIASYDWDFGDPSSGANVSTLADPTHQYATAGNYDVTLTTTSNTGCKSVITKTITVNSLPVVDFPIPASTCVGEAIKFTAATDGFEPVWDFGSDPGRYIENNIAYHSYDVAGTYQVTFSAQNIYGCEATITKSIMVVDNPFFGEINLSQNMPMCEGDEVTLIGPSGGFVYLWSNGETTESITTEQAGIYSVTVTSNDGCQYIPKAVTVNTIKPINPSITGYLSVGVFDLETYKEEMEICQGQNISLGVQYFSSSTYEWSNGATSNYLYSGLDNLSVGEHIFTVTVTEPDYNCAIEAAPFKVIVHPLPAAFQISSDQAGECEGPAFTFSVVSPDPSLNYFWNNGMTGTSITVSQPGFYYADAYNEFGCSTSSNTERISALPNIARMLTGCQESCFPDTLCVASSPWATNYTWFMDGVEVPGADQSELVINGIGDYQVELTNASGCSVTSDILSISPELTDQSLGGLVYFDNNNDGDFNAGDEVIPGASVHIVSSGTILETDVTDVTGNYLFDPVPISVGDVVLDTVGLGIKISESSILLYSFEITGCDGELRIDFPVMREDCELTTSDITLFTCPDEPVEYNGVFYNAGDTPSISNFDNAGCETIVNLMVMQYLDYSYQLTTFPSCDNVDEGILSINISQGDDLSFSLDGGTNFSNNLEFTNLPAGNHTLIAMDINGCTTTEDFTIPSYNSPPVSFVVNDICPGGTDGSITIDNSASANMEFAVDNNSSFTNTATISNLSAGDHILYVLDEDGCAHEYNFNIGVYAEPEITYDTYDSCTDHYLGAIFVMTSDLSLDFSLNGIDYSDQTDFLDLDVGDHILYVETADNCVFTYPFTIGSFGLISIDIDIKNACAGMDNGEINILNSTGLELSMDGLNYNAGEGFSDLAAGDYFIYAQDDNQCPIQLPFTIEEVESAELAFTDPIIDCQTEEVDLGVLNLNTADLQYTWSNGETSSNIIIEETGIYQVTIESECETRSYEWDIQFERDIDLGLPAFVPNIFSPESEDLNSEFKPLINKEIILMEYNFSIYDRWGNKMFQTDDNQEYWDGLYKNKNVEPGVFVWRIEMEYTKCDEPSTFQQYGDVTVIR